MPYATEEDMRVRYGAAVLEQLCPPDLPDPEGPEGDGGPSAAAVATQEATDGDSSALAAALADASETIDAYAAARYAVPLNPVPAPVRRWCCDIARWYLDHAKTDPAVLKAYEDAMRGLADMAKGVLVFQCEGVAAQETPAGQVDMSGPRRLFSMQGMRGY